MKSVFVVASLSLLMVWSACAQTGVNLRGQRHRGPVEGAGRPLPPPPAMGQPGSGGGAGINVGGGTWIERRIATPEFMEQAHIKPEQAQKIKAAFQQIDEQNRKIEEDVRIHARRQAEMAKHILAEAGSDTTEIMAMVEKIGALRTEQAKLATRRLFVVRDHLTPDQRKKVFEMLEEEQRRWRAAREEGEKRN